MVPPTSRATRRILGVSAPTADEPATTAAAARAFRECLLESFTLLPRTTILYQLMLTPSCPVHALCQMPIADGVAIGRFSGVISRRESIGDRQDDAGPRHMTRHIKLSLGLVLTLGGLTM